MKEDGLIKRASGYLSSNRKLVAGFCLFFLSLCVYLRTLAPTVTFEDSGDFITAVYTLGVPHPPGFPLYVLIGRLFTLLPIGEVAFRVNLVSAFFASLTVVLVYFIGVEFIKQNPSPVSFVSAVFAALALSFSHTFWSQAVIAEVYTLSAFFLALLILILLVWEKKVESFTPLLYIFVFLYGLSLAVHPIMLIFSPVFLGFILATDHQRLLSVKRLPFMFLLLLLGLSVYLYLPISAAREPLKNWGDPSSFSRFLDHVTMACYRSDLYHGSGLIVFSFAELIPRIIFYFRTLVRQFTPYLVFLGPVGIWASFKKHGKRFWLLLGLFAVNILVCVVFLRYMEYWKSEEVYFIPSFMVFSLWMGMGAGVLLDLIFRRRFDSIGLREVAICGLALLIALIPLFAHYRCVDKSRYFFAYDRAASILDVLEPKSLLVINGGDNTIFPIEYMQYVEERRPDVAIVVASPRVMSWYRWDILRRYPLVKVPSLPSASKAKLVSQFVTLNLGSQPLYLTHYDLRVDKRYGLVYVGSAFRVGKEQCETGERVLPHLRGQNDTRVYKDDNALGALTKSHFDLGAFYLGRGFPEKALIEYRKILHIMPKSPYVHEALGICHYHLGNDERAIDELLEAKELYDPSAGEKTHTHLGMAYIRSGRFDEAVSLYKRFLAFKPDAIPCRCYLGVAYACRGEYDLAIKEYRLVLQREPDFALAHYYLGLAYEEKGLPKKAAVEFKKYLKLEPDGEWVAQAREHLERL